MVSAPPSWENTPRQIALQQALGLPTPRYIHLPVVLNAQGQKLSKQNLAPAQDDNNPLPTLWQALTFLGQQPPPELLEGELDSLWQWAVENWQSGSIPRKLALPLAGDHHDERNL